MLRIYYIDKSIHSANINSKNLKSQHNTNIT